MENENKPVSIFKYRGYEVEIFIDDYGQQFYCYLDGEEIGFGAFNTEYKEDLKYLIDKKLDFIDYVSGGGILEWFDNGNYRDIKLSYHGRIIKIFLVSGIAKISSEDLEKIKLEGSEFIKKLENKQS